MKTTAYRAYLRSAEWRAKRQWALERARGRCQLCNKKGGLQVHHRTYENLGHELPEDLIVLCSVCHERHHEVLETSPYDEQGDDIQEPNPRRVDTTMRGYTVGQYAAARFLQKAEDVRRYGADREYMELLWARAREVRALHEQSIEDYSAEVLSGYWEQSE